MAKAKVFASAEAAASHAEMAATINEQATARVARMKELVNARNDGEVSRPGPEVYSAIADSLAATRRDMLLSAKAKGSKHTWVQQAIDLATADLVPDEELTEPRWTGVDGLGKPSI